MLPAFAPARGGSIPPTPSIHRLRRGLPGYLIRFAPHALAPQRRPSAQETASATGVPPDICAFHRYTGNSILPYLPLVRPYPPQATRLSLGFSRQTRQTAYELFTPNNSGQRLRPTYYRGCWHVVSRRFFPTYRHVSFVGGERGLQPEGLHPPRGVAASGFRPLRNIPHCCLP